MKKMCNWSYNNRRRKCIRKFSEFKTL